jgi:hypothetical protein
MRVAHGDGGDEIAVEQSRAGEREAVAADHAAFVGLSKTRRQRRDLLRLLALVAGERASEGVEQQIFAVLFNLVRKLVVGQCGCKSCQHLRCFFRHQALLWTNGSCDGSRGQHAPLLQAGAADPLSCEGIDPRVRPADDAANSRITSRGPRRS